jgi:cell division protein FtsI (penicillin-binding protein 3)
VTPEDGPGRRLRAVRKPPPARRPPTAPRPSRTGSGRLPGGGAARLQGGRAVRQADGAGRLQGGRAARLRADGAGPLRGGRPGRPPQARVLPARPSLRRAGHGRRLSLSLICITVAFVLVAARLVQLEGLHSAYYRAVAQQQMLPPQPSPIPVLRGAITSSDGTTLAMTVQTDLVYVDPVLIPQGKRTAVAAALAGPLGMSQAALLALIDHPSSPQYQVLKKNVPAATGTRISDLMNSLNLPGIAEQASYSRIYPNGDLAANLLGFTDTDTAGDLRGEAGLEEEYNSLLSGRDGSEQAEMTPGADPEPIPGTEQTLRAPVAAGSLQLTIQADIQWYAEQACAAEVKAAHAKDCSVVVMQPHTGRILALAQYPTFNPADPASVAATTDIPVADVFQPGSTAKVITAAASFERGGQTPMSTYTVPDQIMIDGYSFHDGEYHPTARYTIAGIIANSLNDGMVQVTQHVSPQIQYDYLRAFGLGQPTGLNLPGETAGILPPPSQWWGDERYTLSFGQGIAVNAVQMASVYATIANGGVRVSPSLVAGTTNGNGTFTPAPAPKQTRVIQPKTASELMDILQQVPMVDSEGGEPWGIIPGYTVAAKTGTSQEAAPGQTCLCEYGSSYIGIVPADNPQLVVAVNVQDPTKGGYYGDEIAGPVFYHVAKFALQTMRIPPDYAKRPYVRLMRP